MKTYIDYHFYVGLENRDDVISRQLQMLSKDPVFNDIIISIARCDAMINIEKIRQKQKEDPSVIEYIAPKLEVYFQGLLKVKLANLEPFDYKYRFLDLKAVIAAAKEEKKTDVQEENRKDKYTSFVRKANKAGLSNEKTEKLWALINQRNEDLAETKKQKKESRNDVTLIDDNTKTPQKIKKEFQKTVTALITLKEYSALLGEELKPNAKKEAKKQLEEVLKVHKLTDEQSKKVYKIIRRYFYNKALHTHYYKYDKRKQKQKLSVVQFYFEKDFKNMMSKFKIDIDNTKKRGDGKYEW